MSKGTDGAVDSVNDDRRDSEPAAMVDGEVRILVADVTVKFDDGKETHYVGELEYYGRGNCFLFNPNDNWCYSAEELEALAKVLRAQKRDVTP
jgi:hypothetical protein